MNTDQIEKAGSTYWKTAAMEMAKLRDEAELRAAHAERKASWAMYLDGACEYLRKYQQRYHGAEHAKKLWTHVDAFLRLVHEYKPSAHESEPFPFDPPYRVDASEPIEVEVFGHKVRARAHASDDTKLREAFDAMVIMSGDQPCYRTSGNIPQGMPKHVERKVRAAMREET